MNLNVVNHALSVGCIQLTAVASASILQVGDTGQINLYSMFDTPPESVIVGPLVPLSAPADSQEAEAEDSASNPDTESSSS
ncbi:spore gernimation protein GerPD [Paenibacillus sepulcri]|uniref:Spore gernimation protein GerPD n=1 Tax=Paenibacillus sepulcri TaxID=359917 RepID=A0ABS7C504_9BACL|nr:spore gernimation protein GerPD [Paenibacillus sepulcri]